MRAINKAIKDTMANPDAAIELLAAKEPLIDKDIEKRRLIFVFKTLIDTPERARVGVGDIVDERGTAAAIETIAESYELPRKPKVDEVFSARSCRKRRIACRKRGRSNG